MNPEAEIAGIYVLPLASRAFDPGGWGWRHAVRMSEETKLHPHVLAPLGLPSLSSGTVLFSAPS